MKIVKSVRIGLLLTTALLASCASLLMPTVETEVATLKAGQYKLDRAHATLLFKVQHLGLSTYVGRFNDFNASLDFDADNISASRLDGVIEIASLDINNNALADDLLTSTWFDAEKYPQATFMTKSVKPISDNEFEFIGDLDWRGVVKEISIAGTFHGGASNILSGKYTLGFSATTSILRSEFGMDAYIPIVGDKIDIEVYVEFQKS
ncbi:MAG: YceI family protein [Acidiferrobacterales bacterium]|nr:YceI family protein [Acidiferrobacterales bacterium]